MIGVKISTLPAADAANATDQLEVNQAGTTRSITIDQLLGVGGDGGAPSGPAGGDLSGTYPDPAIKANVALTGNPTAPTPLTADNDTSIATTAFVKAQGYATTASIPASLPPSGAATGDLTGTYPAPTIKASVGLTGTPTAPTPGAVIGTELVNAAWVLAKGYTSSTGTVTSTSVVSANGLAGTVASASTTPAITLSTTINGMLKGNATAISAAVADTDYVTPSGLTTALVSYLPTAGGTLTGGLAGTAATFSGNIITTGGVFNVDRTGDAATAEVNISTDTSSAAALNLRTGTSTRWIIRKNATAEGGSDAGSNFEILARTDAGGTLSTPLTITRSTGAVAVTGELTTRSGTAVGAGANTQAFIKASSTANLGIYYGTGDPTFSAAKGSLYSKTDATTTTTRLWVNHNGTTGWASLTTSV